MQSLIEQIKSGHLWDFPGGIHPPENKVQSNKCSPAMSPIPAELVIPVRQHIGKAGDLLVKAGDTVLKGQPLTQTASPVMLPVHAPTSGTIKAIEPRTIAHPSGLTELCVVLTPDNQGHWCDRIVCPDYQSHTPEALIEIIRQAGISGMGGAGFPTARKLQAGLARTKMLIINAAECEPYITADDVLMQYYADEIIQGIAITEHIIKPEAVVIGIEDNKPEAIRALEKAAADKDYIIRVIPTKYPSGGEKQLIKVLTNQEVPAGKIPADIGMTIQNVGTMYAVWQAVIKGQPLIERLVTLTGNTFQQPRNVWALIGTPVEHLLNEFDYKADKKLPRLIMGGPMMGFTLPHAQVPVTKTTNCILAPSRKEVASQSHELACIRCGQCAEACPASLLPQQLYWHAKAEEYDKCETLNLKDCIECGACAYVCPSHIPLVQYYRQAKAEIRSRELDAIAAERAKQRFEAKQVRQEREKQERELRFKKAADNRRQTMVQQQGGQDAIQAAIERVKAQKAATPAEPAVKPAVAAAIARAKAKQEAARQSGAAEPDNSEMIRLREERKRQAREKKAAQAVAEVSPDASATEEPGEKKAAVAAAIARAKARKAQQQAEEKTDTAENTAPEPSQAPAQADDPKKAAVAAAIARAKARKAQQQAETKTDTAENTTPEPSQAPAQADDPKKAAVAAAIARAKARKAQQQAEAKTDTAENATPEPSQAPAQADDPKKAAVAAAIARAKARKAQQQAEEKTDTAENTTQEPSQASAQTDDPKKAAVAAAIARAKARKAQQQAEAKTDTAENTTPESSQAPAQTDDPKKAAVAAAVARAKARKAQQQAEAEKRVEADRKEKP